MRRPRAASLYFWTLIAVHVSCGGDAVVENDQGPREDPNDPPSLEFTDKSRFCRERSLAPREGSVRILVDGSGSMVGFRGGVPRFLDWARHAISILTDSTLRLTELKVCVFREGLGIGECVEAGQRLADYRPSGNTNLHEALRASSAYELTLILTDGVAATGGMGTGDCAGGVDAACVARALRDAVHQGPEGLEEVDRGLWVLPFVAGYDGTFYTEMAAPDGHYDWRSVVERVRADTGSEATIQDPRRSAQGHLVFGYRGPRALLWLVVARHADVGRAAVQALWERAGQLGVKGIEDLRQYGGSLASFPPVEVYPGFLNEVAWESLQVDEESITGTIDVTLDPAAGRPRVRIACPAGESGAAKVHLSGRSPVSARISGCVDIGILPAYRLEAQAGGPEQEGIVRAFLGNPQTAAGSYERLTFNAACQPATSQACTAPLIVQVGGSLKFGGTADALAAASGGGWSMRLLKAITTRDPRLDPHLIYAFAPTLDTFYREVLRDERVSNIGTLALCGGPGS